MSELVVEVFYLTVKSFLHGTNPKCISKSLKNKSCLHRKTYAPDKRFDRSYEHFSKLKRILQNQSADPNVKVKGVKMFVLMEGPCPYTHAYLI